MAGEDFMYGKRKNPFQEVGFGLWAKGLGYGRAGGWFEECWPEIHDTSLHRHNKGAVQWGFQSLAQTLASAAVGFFRSGFDRSGRDGGATFA
jgi:hypothetical protein